MTRETLLIVGLLCLGVTVPAAATPARRAGAASATRLHAADRAAVSPHAEAARRLEDIHIEGELPVPQVLFITARDQRRFMEFQHHRYLRTSRQLGEATILPSEVVTNGTGMILERRPVR